MIISACRLATTALLIVASMAPPGAAQSTGRPSAPFAFRGITLEMSLTDAKRLSHPDRPNDSRFGVVCTDDKPEAFEEILRVFIPPAELTICGFKAPGENFPWPSAQTIFGSARGELIMRFVKISENKSQLYELHWHSEHADLKELWNQLEKRYGPATQTEHNMRVWSQGEATLTVTENFGRGAIVTLSNNRLAGIAAEYQQRPRL